LNRIVIGVACGLATLVLAATASAGIRITQINFDSPGAYTGSNSSLNAEWLRLKNTGSTARKLTGWTVRDTSGHVYKFGTYKLGAGKTVTIHSGKGSNTARDRYWRSDGYMWNNDGDIGKLKNKAGNVIDTCSYSGSGSSVSPMSFTSKLLRSAWRANTVERALRNPARYAQQRAKSKAMSSVGFWRAWNRWWRA
jgi:hypothetical protein